MLDNGQFRTEAATEAQYQQRIHLQNTVFGDEIRPEGVIELAYEKGVISPLGETGRARVTSQPFRDGRSTTNEKIAAFLSGSGFRKAPAFHVWYRMEDGILVSDAHIGNFVEVQGVPIPIDLHMNQVPPDAFRAAGWA